MSFSFIEGAIPPGFTAQLLQQDESYETGALSFFLGRVRADKINGQTIAGIAYTAYTDMAIEKMQELEQDLTARFDLHDLKVFHSLGTVPAGGLCLLVLASARHRRAAIDACNELVERIKQELPVWGKEVFEDASHQWKTNN